MGHAALLWKLVGSATNDSVRVGSRSEVLPVQTSSHLPAASKPRLRISMVVFLHFALEQRVKIGNLEIRKPTLVQRSSVCVFTSSYPQEFSELGFNCVSRATLHHVFHVSATESSSPKRLCVRWSGNHCRTTFVSAGN